MATILSNNNKAQIDKQKSSSFTTTASSLKYCNNNGMSSVYDAASLVFADGISQNKIHDIHYDNLEEQIQGLIFKIKAGLLMSKCWYLIDCSTFLYHIELIVMLASYSMQLKIILSKVSSSSSSSSSSLHINKNKIKCCINLIQDTKNELEKIIKILNDMITSYNRGNNNDRYDVKDIIIDNVKQISIKKTTTSTNTSYTTKPVCDIIHYHTDNDMKQITFNYYHLLYDKAKKLLLNL
jgi:hypothetical protein